VRKFEGKVKVLPVHVMKASGQAEVWLHSILTSARGRCPADLLSEKRPQYVLNEARYAPEPIWQEKSLVLPEYA